MAKEKEPITPFLSKIKALADMKVSCILVIGGSGDYFSVADTVLCMEDFVPKDVTSEAHAIAKQFGDIPAVRDASSYGQVTARTPTLIHPASGDGEVQACMTVTLQWPVLMFPALLHGHHVSKGNEVLFMGSASALDVM